MENILTCHFNQISLQSDHPVPLLPIGDPAGLFQIISDQSISQRKKKRSSYAFVFDSDEID